MPGGKRPGAGRPRGSKNKVTVERVARAEAGVAAALAGDETPLSVMLRVMRGESGVSDRQYAAARDAAPYVHPKLAAVEHTGAGGGPIEIQEARERLAVRLARRAAGGRSGGAAGGAAT